jgi:hypothetical protein
MENEMNRKLEIVRISNGQQVSLTPLETTFLRINPFSLRVERLKIEIKYCSWCCGCGCANCGYTGNVETLNDNLFDGEIWDDVSDSYKTKLNGEII